MKVKIYEYLKDNKEKTPAWIMNYKKGDEFNIREVLKNRTLFYPGAGSDGFPIKIFNKSGFINTFIYADYGMSNLEKRKELESDSAFKGYHLLEFKELSEKELAPSGWRRHYNLNREQFDEMIRMRSTSGYAFLSIYERDKDYDDSHGNERFAVIYIGGDGIATYDALYINNNISPTVYLLQDHGFGCNYNSFGKNSIQEELIVKNKNYPEYVYSHQEDNIYNRYEKINDLYPEIKYGNKYYLYKYK